MFLLVVLLLYSRRYGTSAQPISSFKQSPTTCAVTVPIFSRDIDESTSACAGRSVQNILWSCLATTFAVTWVSVHPNIPRLNEGQWSITRRKVFLMMLALIAPEVMLMWAFKQWRGAVAIRDQINEKMKNLSLEGVNPWTMVHAHFQQMGGFKLCTTERNDNWRSKELYDYTSSKNGIQVWEGVLLYGDFLDLLDQGKIEFPELSEEEIKDRSKGDALSKGFALLQITWFILELFARASLHLAITEIELTTAALAGLNSLMFLCWWSKPLGVRCPIVIRTKELERKLVEGATKSRKTASTTKELNPRDTPSKGENSPAEKLTKRSWDDFYFGIICRLLVSPFAQFLVTPPTQLLHGTGRLRADLHVGRIEDEEREIGDRESKVANPACQAHTSECKGGSSSHTADRLIVRIWKSLRTLISSLFYLPFLSMVLPVYQITRPYKESVRLDGYKDARDLIRSKPTWKLLIDDGDMRWILSMILYCEDDEERPLIYFSALTGAIFGSIHCAAWNFAFPSPTEKLIWRIASLLMVGVCLCIIACAPLYSFMRRTAEKAGSEQHNYVWASYWLLARKGFVTIPAIVYPVARLSLLILAILSLRKNPETTFATVEWSSTIPHI